MEETKEAPAIPQTQIATKNNKITAKVVNVKLAQKLNFNRVLTPTLHYTTLPYGYIGPKK